MEAAVGIEDLETKERVESGGVYCVYSSSKTSRFLVCSTNCFTHLNVLPLLKESVFMGAKRQQNGMPIVAPTDSPAPI
jgi:hypothetical protein